MVLSFALRQRLTPRGTPVSHTRASQPRGRRRFGDFLVSNRRRRRHDCSDSDRDAARIDDARRFRRSCLRPHPRDAFASQWVTAFESPGQESRKCPDLLEKRESGVVELYSPGPSITDACGGWEVMRVALGVRPDALGLSTVTVGGEVSALAGRKSRSGQQRSCGGRRSCSFSCGITEVRRIAPAAGSSSRFGNHGSGCQWRGLGSVRRGDATSRGRCGCLDAAASLSAALFGSSTATSSVVAFLRSRCPARLGALPDCDDRVLTAMIVSRRHEKRSVVVVDKIARIVVDGQGVQQSGVIPTAAAQRDGAQPGARGGLDVVRCVADHHHLVRLAARRAEGGTDNVRVRLRPLALV
jgi:hypothetical protein